MYVVEPNLAPDISCLPYNPCALYSLRLLCPSHSPVAAVTRHHRHHPRLQERCRQFGVIRTIIDPQTVGVGGGILTYKRLSDPLSSFELFIPASAYSTVVTWTIRADSSVWVPLPADFSLAGPVLVVSNGRGYADSLITVTAPVNVGPDDAVSPFYFDQAAGTFEGIPVMARTDSTITFATRHFSGDLLAIPGTAPGSSDVRGAIVPYMRLTLALEELSTNLVVLSFRGCMSSATDFQRSSGQVHKPVAGVMISLCDLQCVAVCLPDAAGDFSPWLPGVKE